MDKKKKSKKNKKLKVVFTDSFMRDMRYHFGGGENFKESIEFFFSHIKDSIRDCKCWCIHAWQRVFNEGIDDTMTFSMDETLAYMIEKMLKQYLRDADGFIIIDKRQREYIKECIKAFKDYTEFENFPMTKKEEKMLKENPKAYFAEKDKQYNDLLRRMRKLFTKQYARLWW
jgi:hypothetical protein